MKTFTFVSVAAILAAFSVSASAGQFEVWSDGAKGANRTVIVSFAGDGHTQDAQADIAFDPGLEFVTANAKVAGSVCAELKGKNMVRVVPPSGAGSALSSKQIDYCAFSFRSRGGKAVAGTGLTVSFTECAGVSGSSNCESNAIDVSEK